ncbi:MAG: hypothetical protein M3320_07380, partial [Actinomycetota bacterium]|nr:hypothetical protein [Actinomycetota bacterium]
MPRPLPFLPVLLVLVGVALLPQTAVASSQIELGRVADATLTAKGALSSACHTRARQGAGVATSTIRVRAAGPIEAR